MIHISCDVNPYIHLTVVKHNTTHHLNGVVYDRALGNTFICIFPVTIPAFLYLHLGKLVKSFAAVAMLQAERDPCVTDIKSSSLPLPQPVHWHRNILF